MIDSILTSIRVSEVKGGGNTIIDVQPPLDNAEIDHLLHLGYAPATLRPGEKYAEAILLNVYPHFVENMTGEDGSQISRITLEKYYSHTRERHVERTHLVACSISYLLRDLRGVEVAVDTGDSNLSKAAARFMFATALERAFAGDPRQTTVLIPTGPGFIRHY